MITKDYKIDWADIENLYTQLQGVQSAHSMQVTAYPPSDHLKAYASTIGDLNSRAYSTHQEEHLRSTAYTTVASPQVGNRIDASVVKTISDNIINLIGRCHQCSYTPPCSHSSNCNCTNFFDDGWRG